jgi:type IV secretory pathway VirB10-like protein
MRKQKLHNLSIALLSAAALFAFACGRKAEEPQVARQEPAPPAIQTTQEAQPYTVDEERIPQAAVPKSPELQPEPQSPPAVIAPEEPESRDDAALAARERELAQRQAELEARERRLREKERQQRAERPAPAPRRETPKPEEKVAETRPAPVEPEPAPEAEEAAPAPEPEPEARTVSVSVPAGTTFAAELQDTLSSASSRVGDTFRARIVDDVVDNGEVVIPAGSEVVGEVTEVVPLRKVGGQARLAVRFTDLVLPSGSTVPIRATLTQQGRNETGRDAATIGGGAAGGAVLGRVLSRKDRSKGALIGAIIGAAAGAVIASRTPGEEAAIPQGTVVNVELRDSVQVRVRR